MAITDHVIMPGSDYEALCNKMRELTGKTDKFTSSQLLEGLSNVKGNVVLVDLTVTENGIYVPAEGIDGYGSVTVNVEKGTSDVDVVYVTFKTYDGATELYKRAVISGNDCMEIVSGGLIDTPVKPSTNTEVYTLSGWALSANGESNANALKNVTENRTVYAAYTASTRYYTVRFYDGSTLLNTMQVAYGATADYTPTKSGYFFNGWQPSNTNITADTDCYAQWSEVPNFVTSSWASIAAVCEAGDAEKYFTLGQRRPFTYVDSGGATISTTLELVAFNHDDLSDGSGKAGITVVAYDVATTNLSYGDAKTFLRNTLLSTLDADLQAVIKSVNKYTAWADGSGETTAEKLWLVGVSEIPDAEPSATYQYYDDGEPFSTYTRRKMKGGTYSTYWLRSYTTTRTKAAVYWSNYTTVRGCLSGATYTTLSGLVFGFCI